MACKGFFSVLVISGLVGLVASATTVLKYQKYAESTCVTARAGISEINLGGGLEFIIDLCDPNDQESPVEGHKFRTWRKITCNTTHFSVAYYSENKCTTPNTTMGVEEDIVGCQDSRKVTCDGGPVSDANLVTVMRYYDATCTKAKFKQFHYYDLGTCYWHSTNKWYKYNCNASSATAPKMVLDYYTDSACTTLDASTARHAQEWTGTCAAVVGSSSDSSSDSSNSSSNNSNGSRRLFEEEEGDYESEYRRLQSSTYVRIYKGCGYTFSGELPAGIEKPPGAAGSALLSAASYTSLSFATVSVIIAMATAFYRG